MREYVGKICPVCNQELTEKDIVITCTECGIPHHESCWKANLGCSTFGCGKQGTYQPPKTNVEKCLKCGNVLEPGQEFCPKCGTPKGKQESAQLEGNPADSVNATNGTSKVGEIIEGVSWILGMLTILGFFVLISDNAAVAFISLVGGLLSCLLLYGFGEIICLLTAIKDKIK